MDVGSPLPCGMTRVLCDGVRKNTLRCGSLTWCYLGGRGNTTRGTGACFLGVVVGLVVGEACYYFAVQVGAVCCQWVTAGARALPGNIF